MLVDSFYGQLQMLSYTFYHNHNIIIFKDAIDQGFWKAYYLGLQDDNNEIFKKRIDKGKLYRFISLREARKNWNYDLHRIHFEQF